MKTLTQYLAEYLDHEHDFGANYVSCFIKSYPDGSVSLDVDYLEQVLKQGMDAYMSTENCEIIISPKPVGQL